mgnify:CR=1 FL=1
MKEIDLSERQKQILAYMDAGVEYSTEQVAENIGLKGPRTRQLYELHFWQLIMNRVTVYCIYNDGIYVRFIHTKQVTRIILFHGVLLPTDT